MSDPPQLLVVAVPERGRLEGVHYDVLSDVAGDVRGIRCIFPCRVVLVACGGAGSTKRSIPLIIVQHGLAPRARLEAFAKGMPERGYAFIGCGSARFPECALLRIQRADCEPEQNIRLPFLQFPAEGLHHS